MKADLEDYVAQRSVRGGADRSSFGKVWVSKCLVQHGLSIPSRFCRILTLSSNPLAFGMQHANPFDFCPSQKAIF
jgi:hypothetical protein